VTELASLGPIPTAARPRRAGRVLTYRSAAILSLLFPPTGVVALVHSLRASSLAAKQRIEEARVAGQKARDWAWISVGVGLTFYVIAFLLWLVFTNDGGVQKAFFAGDLLFDRDTWISLLKGFWINVQVFIWAEIIVLVWAMVVAIVRLLPGGACAPVRWLATAYVDVFRGIPSVLVILLVGIGLPQAQVPVAKNFSDIEMSVLALSLTYGAYVSEVYRAGIESVHWSQTAAARSLGLSYFQTLRHVVVPQALRRIGPPLLNDFIGLQKDTALIGFIGVLDVVARARFANNSAGSLTAYTMAAMLFLAVTLPFTRYLDYILRRQKRLLAGTA
jgi:polar amino acid transport system permease protein